MKSFMKFMLVAAFGLILSACSLGVPEVPDNHDRGGDRGWSDNRGGGDDNNGGGGSGGGKNPGNDKPVGKSPFDGKNGEVPSGK